MYSPFHILLFQVVSTQKNCQYEEYDSISKRGFLKLTTNLLGIAALLGMYKSTADHQDQKSNHVVVCEFNQPFSANGVRTGLNAKKPAENQKENARGS